MMRSSPAQKQEGTSGPVDVPSEAMEESSSSSSQGKTPSLSSLNVSDPNFVATTENSVEEVSLAEVVKKTQ